MAVYRCKMCGGDLSIVEGASYCTCEFCGTQQTIPTVKDEGLQNLFNRANLLRMKSEFDKAAEIYEKILQRSATEAEAYWGLILCKYGIEYVEDPTTFKRIPPCHRASYDAVTTDEDYKNALKYADTVQRGIYEEQAKEIDQLQKGILNIVQKEKPYDVFICYKETDENGKRTPDSVIANDIYHQLTIEGFKVFYAAITLEDKLGTEYEPYIFSALNTAKVMLAIGTKPEYFNAVWVKNEWSRFLKIMKKDRSRLLIPCYRDMDPYELPEEFAHLQAQDMSKIGFINDIVRGIKKVVIKETSQAQPQDFAAIQPGAAGTTATAQIKRGNLALEDHEWEKADGFFEEALNLDPECAEAYLGKLLARDREPGFASWIKMQKEKYSNASPEKLEACPEDQARIRQAVQEYVLHGYLDAETIWQGYAFDLSYSSVLSSRNMQKQKQLSELSADRLLTRAKQYAKGDTKQQIDAGITELTNALDGRITEAREQDEASIARVKAAYAVHMDTADKKAQELHADALNRQEQRYQDAVASIKPARDVQAYSEVLHALTDLDGYKDSNELAARCKKEIDRLNEEKRQEEERQAAVRRQKAEQQAQKQKKYLAIIGALTALIVICIAVVTKVIIPNSNYNAAVALMDSKDYEAAIASFEALNGYKDSKEKILECNYQKALSLVDAGEYDKALTLLTDLGGYKDSAVQINDVHQKQYDHANDLEEAGNLQDALKQFEALGTFKDSEARVSGVNAKIEEKRNADYLEKAVGYLENGKNIDTAVAILKNLRGFRNADEYLADCYYLPSELINRSNSDSRDQVYIFEYDDSGNMIAAAHKGITKERDDVAVFDPETHNPTKGFESTSTQYIFYDNEAEEIITKYSETSKYARISDMKYGNTIASIGDKGRTDYEGLKYDSHHNRISSDGWTTSSIKNTYDENGCLTNVSTVLNNYHADSEISYRVLYSPNKKIDVDFVWRNIRLLCGDEIW